MRGIEHVVHVRVQLHVHVSCNLRKYESTFVQVLFYEGTRTCTRVRVVSDTHDTHELLMR